MNYLFFAVLVLSQLPQGGEVFKKEWRLEKLVAPPDATPEAVAALKEKMCGAYVLSVPQTQGSLIGGIVFLNKGPKMFLDHQKVFKTVIDDNKNIPTLEYMPTNIAVVDVFRSNDDPVLSVAVGVVVTLRISQADYDQAARCLPPPAK